MTGLMPTLVVMPVILPLVVAGTRSAMRRGSLVFGRSRAEVRALEPIPTDGMTLADVPALRDRVRELIIAARAELRRDLAADGRRDTAGAPLGA